MLIQIIQNRQNKEHQVIEDSCSKHVHTIKANMIDCWLLKTNYRTEKGAE